MLQLKPNRDRILVKLLPFEKKSEGGIVLPDSARRASMHEARKGIVMAVGPGNRDSDGRVLKPLIEVGDSVMVMHHLGQTVDLYTDGDERDSEVEYLLYSEADILATYTLGAIPAKRAPKSTKAD